MPEWPALLMRQATKLWRRPAGRISLAIGLSLLVHALVLFAPLIELPKSKVPLPPLTAKLEPLPPPPAPAQKKKPRPKPKPVEKAAAQAQESAPETTDEAPQAGAGTQPAEAAAEETAKQARPLLPRHAQLTFSVYQGNGGLQLGESVHRLDIEEGRYTLKALTQTTGIASFFKTYVLTQSSEGEAGAQGLLPHRFAEEKKLSGGSQTLDAEFDWEARRLRFSRGGEAELAEQAQDILSVLYQLSQMPMSNQEVMPLRISNGKKLEYYELEIGAEEEIDTPLGKLRALPLRKIHAKGEEGLDIWLGLEYRLLPIKVRQIERSGEIAGEMVISDIRVSDE
jgi:hypothetical protein